MIFQVIRSHYTNNKTMVYLFSIFILLFLSETVLSFYFASPFRLPDEVEYFTKAAAVFHSHNFFASPPWGNTFPGYPIVLSIFFGISQSPLLIYHLLLIFNAGLVSLTVFPIYYILSEYCSEKISLIGTIIVATLPNIIVYPFSVVSENFFIPLLIFSSWFFVEYYKTSSKFFSFLLGLTLIILTLSRPTGFVTALSFFIVLFFTKSADFSKPRKVTAIVSFLAISAITCVLLTYLVINGTLYLSGYNVSEFLKDTLHLIGAKEFFFLVFSRFLFQVEYLVLSGYCIFFLLAGLLFISLFYSQWVTRAVKFNLTGNLDAPHARSLKAFALYILFVSVPLILITTCFLLDSSAAPASQQIDIYGRYLDPIVPLFFIFGIISLALLFEHIKRPGSFFFSIIAGSALSMSILFILTFPFISNNNYILWSILPIGYILVIKNILPLGLFIAILFIGFTLFFISGFYSNKIKYTFFIAIIILSIFINGIAIGTELSLSTYWDSQNQIGKFLSENSNENSVTIIDLNSAGDRTYIWLSLFLVKGSVINVGLSQKNTLNLAFPVKNIDYIISSKNLDYPAVGFDNSNGGFTLYVLNTTSQSL